MWNDAQAKRLGTVLRELRNEKGLSQETLAYRSGITKNQLQLIEAGRASGKRDEPAPSNPRMATLVGLAETLEISVSSLLTRADL